MDDGTVYACQHCVDAHLTGSGWRFEPNGGESNLLIRNKAITDPWFRKNKLRSFGVNFELLA